MRGYRGLSPHRRHHVVADRSQCGGERDQPPTSCTLSHLVGRQVDGSRARSGQRPHRSVDQALNIARRVHAPAICAQRRDATCCLQSLKWGDAKCWTRDARNAAVALSRSQAHSPLHPPSSTETQRPASHFMCEQNIGSAYWKGTQVSRCGTLLGFRGAEPC